MKLNKIFEEIVNEDIDRKAYLKWRRQNVSVRGMSNGIGEANGGSSILGSGLYTVPLSNKRMAKDYGEIRFVVNAVPKKPLIVNSMNDWEIWAQRNLFMMFNKDYPDQREFYKHTTIEVEMMKMGYDGAIIKGREMVIYKPKDIYYFKQESEVVDYYQYNVEYEN